MKLLTAVTIILGAVASNVAAGNVTDVRTYVPHKAIELMPVLNKAIDELWASMPMRSYLPSQVEQESCISLIHSKCWSPSARLKTAREEGIGLGQYTRTWDKNGKIRFDVLTELVQKHPKELKGWSWANAADPLLQIKAIVLKNRFNWNKLTFPIHDETEKMAFLAATYNGGSVLKDRTICQQKPGCDPSSWFSTKGSTSVESFSFKSKIKQKGYGKSFFEISREYPRLVIHVRRPKYVQYTGS